MTIKARQIYTEQLIAYIDTPVIKVITGIRRCGKSYLLKLLTQTLRERGVKDDQIIKIDFESLKFEPYRHYTPLYEHISERAQRTNGKVYILIDEIQEVEGWERAIRSFQVDLNCDIYLTGSNAHLLSGELATYLSGRYIELQLYTLSFKEYLYFNRREADSSADRQAAFYDYIEDGGFPGLHLMPQDEHLKRQYVRGIYNSVVLKDIVQRHRIRDVELLERVLIYIMNNIGQTFSAKKIADYLKSQGRRVGVESIYSYIRAFEQAMIIHTAKRYDVKGKRLLDRTEKYFLADLGIRSSLMGDRGNDISQQLENIVYLELRRQGYTVYVGKEGDREIDFIAEKDGRRLYVQVTYLLASAEVIEREFSPLLKLRDQYPKFVISLDSAPMSPREGVEWMNLIDFILELGENTKIKVG